MIRINEDGSAVTDFTDRTIEYLTREHPRTALGYYAPGHYCLLSVSGYQGGFPGVSLEELSAFFVSLGCRSAYNLDGGGSSTMYFNGQVVNNPTTNGKIKERGVSDIVYIGS